MEDTKSVLTVREVATLLRCSRAHVRKALGGKVAGVPQLAHVTWAGANWFGKNGWNNGSKEGKPSNPI